MLEFILSTTNQPPASRRLTRAVMAILGDFISNDELLYDLDLALTEACANVVRHAYEGRSGKLEILLRVEPSSHVEFEVADWGRGLNPDSICFDAPDPSAEGGRGFFLMKRLTDDFSIDQSEGKNVIRMRKTIGKESWKQQ